MNDENQGHLWDGTPMAALQHRITKGSEPAVQLPKLTRDELMRQCREDGHAVTYKDLEALRAVESYRLAAINAELLEALKDLLNDTQHLEHEDCEDGPCPVRDARAAIAKAQGEQP